MTGHLLPHLATYAQFWGWFHHAYCQRSPYPAGAPGWVRAAWRSVGGWACSL